MLENYFLGSSIWCKCKYTCKWPCVTDISVCISPRTPAPQPCRSRSSSLDLWLRISRQERWRSCTWCRCAWRSRTPDPRSILQTGHFLHTSPSSSSASRTVLPKHTHTQRERQRWAGMVKLTSKLNCIINYTFQNKSSLEDWLLFKNHFWLYSFFGELKKVLQISILVSIFLKAPV